MKRRRDGGEEAGGRAATRIAGSSFDKQQQKKKNRRKLGGGGLSLEAFAAAKSKPLANSAQIREHREFYKNAKKVQKYKKLVKQLGGQDQSGLSEGHEAADKPIKEQDSEVAIGESVSKKKSTARKELPLVKTDGKQFKAHKKQAQLEKGASQLERMREEFEKEKLDKEEKRREREELYAEQQQAREKSQRERKEVQSRLRKKTRKGQPVMKHRMELLLETIQRG